MDRLTYSSASVDAELLPDLGARLHRLRVFGQDLLRTPDDFRAYALEPFFWGSFVMAPWCNRIEAGTVRVGSRQVRLDPNFPDGTAIHGQVYSLPWELQHDGALRVQGGGDGWPWDYEVTLQVDVGDQGLRLAHTLVNRSAKPMPAGIGIHPWFRKPVQLAIHGDAVFGQNAEAPTESEPVHGPSDLRALREMPHDLDATWTELAKPPVKLLWPTLGVQATMSVTAPDIFIVAASPASLDAIAVEPQTHVPQGLRRLLNHEPGALAMLGPDESLRMTVELAFEQLSDGWSLPVRSRRGPAEAQARPSVMEDHYV